MAPSFSDFESSNSCDRSMSVTEPMPSHRAHMPPATVNTRFSVFPAPFSIEIWPTARTEGTLNEKALGGPMWGSPRRLQMTRKSAFASVAVPTVERELAPMRSWSTRMAVVSPSSRSTSGRARIGMNPWRNALYVSLMRRCDSAAIVPNTSDDLPEPETPVNTVRRRLGMSTLTFFRLFSRPPRTRRKAWPSAGCWAGGSAEEGKGTSVARSARKRGLSS